MGHAPQQVSYWAIKDQTFCMICPVVVVRQTQYGCTFWIVDNLLEGEHSHFKWKWIIVALDWMQMMVACVKVSIPRGCISRVWGTLHDIGQRSRVTEKDFGG